MTLKEWINTFKEYENIVVLASGPSTLKAIKSKKDLYITTNNSIQYVKNHNFIYYTNTLYFIRLAINLGFKKEGWQGTIFFS